MPRALLVALLATLAVAVSAKAVLPEGNVVANPGAEDGPGSSDSTTINPPPGWVTTGTLTAIQYGTGGYPGTDVSNAIGGGANFFSGGTSAVSTGEQLIDLSAAAPEIDAGDAQLNLSAQIGGYLNQEDAMQVTATLEAPSGATTAEVQVGPVAPEERENETTLLPRAASVGIPPGTRRLRVTLTATRFEGSANDGYADNVSAEIVPRPPLPEPEQGETANAEVAQGTVLVRLGGRGQFIRLEDAQQVPVGSVFDTRKGTVELTTAGSGGAEQTGQFRGAVFGLQQASENPLTTMSLKGGGLNRCGRSLPKGGSPKVSAAARRRSLFGSANGRFRTRGRNSTATVRGTTWRVTDTCKGTLTRVQEGTVVVRDLVLKKNRVLRAGQQYLAKAPKRGRRR